MRSIEMPSGPGAICMLSAMAMPAMVESRVGRDCAGARCAEPKS
jgi:hypothetical protein